MCIPITTRCTSLSSLLFILIFIKSHIMFLHIQFVLHILLFYTFLYSIAHFTSYFFFTYIYIYSCVVLLLYNLILILFFIFFILCTVHWADLIWPTFHFWLYPVSFIMWQIKKPWTLISRYDKFYITITIYNHDIVIYFLLKRFLLY